MTCHPGANNLIAIRVYDAGGRGGFKGDAPALIAAGRSDQAGRHLAVPDGRQAGMGHSRCGDAEAPPEFKQVIDAAGVSARTYQHQGAGDSLSRPAESLARFKTAEIW